MTATSAPPRQLPRLLDGQPDLDGHLRRHGRQPLPAGAGPLTALLERAGLTGRGGAAFPTYRKLDAVAEAAARTRRAPVVVGNAAEGEPAAAKDRTLLRHAPHLVLDGLQCCATALGAERAVLYLGPDMPWDRLRTALAERVTTRVDRVPVELVAAPRRFLAGQETAAVARIAGGDAMPGFAAVRVAERGVAGAPTLVQNVETLAHLALVTRYGADWFRAAGTPDEPGTALCTVHRTDRPMAVVEAELGTPLSALLPLDGTATGAVLVGGYHGAWLPARVARDLRLANLSLRQHGATVGAGVLAALPADRCGLVETARVVRYLALESAGQCGPCLNGLPRIAAALDELARSRPRPALRHPLGADLARWAGLVERRGACHHPDGTARLVRSALTVFAGEADRHQRGRCTGTSGTPLLPVPDRPPGGWR
jgi:NADH:ubiquinone oxidoreductase subunit F (NADH-binding)